MLPKTPPSNLSQIWTTFPPNEAPFELNRFLKLSFFPNGLMPRLIVRILGLYLSSSPPPLVVNEAAILLPNAVKRAIGQGDCFCYMRKVTSTSLAIRCRYRYTFSSSHPLPPSHLPPPSPHTLSLLSLVFMARAGDDIDLTDLRAK